MIIQLLERKDMKEEEKDEDMPAADENNPDNEAEPPNKKRVKKEHAKGIVQINKLLTDKEVQKMIKDDELINLSVQVLRETCVKRDIPNMARATKRAMIKALTKYFE